MKKDGKEFSVTVWSAVALGAIGIGVIVAFLAGYFLGHFTGHDKTTTVSAVTAPAESGGEATEASSEGGIEPAPAFTAAELEAEPGDDWITNGGSMSNHRYSTLDEINTENVKELKGDFLTKIGANATAAKFSAEGQALEYKGTLYITDGADDVYAIDASSGKILWEYEPNLPPEPLGSVVCCGWDNRGVALGDGMVFVSQLNGEQVALDQMTGKVKWATPVVKPGEGYTITSAPLYYNGLLYVGGSGGEYGIRGRLTALDANTGKTKWRFYTVPGPGEYGHETWPQGNDAWKRGGAGIWNTPTVDPKLNMLYFSTSNAAPWVGAGRPGDNLFTASIVALNAETGEYKWHYQQVHHDIWDLDSPSPTVLVEGEMEGKEREGVAQPSKTGFLYILDRKTGEPIFPIEEKPVPQDHSEATAAKQPYPTLPPFSPQTPTPQMMKETEASVSEKPAPKLKAAPLFTPWSHNPKVINVSSPNATGGDNWPPSSFDPETNMYFVCSQSGTMGLIATGKPPKYVPGENYIGFESGFVSSGFNTPGFLTAYDLGTGEIAWQKKFPDACYSGAVTTAGGLVFVGRNNGDVEAYNSENGELLWSFQTGAGANTTVTPFEDEGEEKIAIYAGGNSLAATPHGENFWVFSLKGTMEPEAGTEAEGEGTKHTGEEKEGEAKEEASPEEEAAPEEEAKEGGEEAAAGGAGNAEAGKSVFAENCSICHGSDGHGGNGGPDLLTMPKAKTEAGAIEQVTDGGGGMPPFKGTLSEEEIKDVAAYVANDIVGGG
ncbi:MAG: PQQ-binding-like beta-propeller repeat protein [Actinobacteria bacterium]|nr:PQQ-binding-like beta-propeller repeat protein [Actinomycetota bacterium]